MAPSLEKARDPQLDEVIPAEKKQRVARWHGNRKAGIERYAPAVANTAAGLHKQELGTGIQIKDRACQNAGGVGVVAFPPQTDEQVIFSGRRSSFTSAVIQIFSDDADIRAGAEDLDIASEYIYRSTGVDIAAVAAAESRQEVGT